MRLNKTLREGILANWHNDKWKKRLDDAMAAFAQTHREKFEASVVHERDVYNNHRALVDHGFLTTSDRFYFEYRDCRDHLPSRLRTFVETNNHFRFNCEPYANGAKTSNHVELDHDAVKKYAKLDKAARTQYDDLTSIVYGCTTVEKLIELVPGIEKYMPNKTSASALPVPMDTVNRVKAFI